MKSEAFKYKSADKKTMIDAVRWLPDNGEYKAVLQITHGMVEYKERYMPFAEFMTENGFMVVAHDHLGHGESVSSKKDWGYMAEGHPSDILVKDMHTLRTTIQKENPGKPYFMLGHSMGSYMLRKYLAKYRKGLDGAIVMGTGCIGDATTKLAMTLTKVMAKFHGWRYYSPFLESLTFLGPYKKYDVTGKNAPKSWLTKDTDIVKAYYSNPKCTFKFSLNAYMGLFEAVYFDNQKKNIDKIPKELPVFIVSGEDDPVGDLGKGVKKVYQKFLQAGMKDVSCKLYKNDRHEILSETDREQVYADLLGWTQKRIK